MPFNQSISRRRAITPSSIRKAVTVVRWLDGATERVASKWSDAPGHGCIWAVPLDGPPADRQFVKLRRKPNSTLWMVDNSLPDRP